MAILILANRLLLMIAVLISSAQQKDTETLASATVGAPTVIQDVILPGSELVAKPLTGDPAMIVQVVDAIRHGDSFRYTFRFSGLEPGPYDLSEWLMRKDGSEIGDVPKVAVEIESLLAAGQITPNELPVGWLPSLGGYKVVMWVAIVLWTLVLLAIIFAGRKKKSKSVSTETPPRTLADLLKERLEAAYQDNVDPQQYAELERMLFSMWRKRLGYEELSLQDAVVKIKADPKAGPLMIQLEDWMHRPVDSDRQVDLPKLLEPYRNIAADELEAVG